MNEWALLIFTLCIQTAVGGIWMLTLFHNKLAQAKKENLAGLVKTPLFTLSGLSILGMLASFTHLGAPFNAFNALNNLGSSWMSREILATGIFIALICVATGLVATQKKLHMSLLIAASAVGIFTIYAMAASYANSFVSGWNSTNTYAIFFGTPLVLGSILIASLIVPSLDESLKETIGHNMLKCSFAIVLLGLAIQVVGMAIFASVIPEVQMIAGANAKEILADYQTLTAMRWIVAGIGAAVAGYLAFAFNKKMPITFAYAALAALVLAEGMGRYVFYVLGS